MQFHRCSICNKTNNEDVETELGDYTNMPFVPDPNNPQFDICMECFESIREILWELEDEENDIEGEDT